MKSYIERNFSDKVSPINVYEISRNADPDENKYCFSQIAYHRLFIVVTYLKHFT